MLNATITFHGPAAEHDMPCAVYRDQPAVFDMNRGVFLPSWYAQRDGWHLVKAHNWWQRWLLRYGFQVEREP